MPISLICSCGARLEIDDKFAGQTIPCPDCNKPITTEPPAPQITRTSGLAVLSLVLALVGAFTVVGTLAAVVCGAVAYRQLSRQRGSVGGLRLAQAGMILGGVFTVLALAAYASPTLFGVDGLVRSYRWAGKLKYGPAALVSKKRGVNDDSYYALERPAPLSAWAVLDTQASQKDGDHLMLVNPRVDAHIMWLSLPRPFEKDAASLRSAALDFFSQSDFVRMIGRMPENVSQAWKPRDITEGEKEQEFIVDVNLGGVTRTFLFNVNYKDDKDAFVNVVAGGTRSQRFDRLKETFKHALGTFKLQEGAK